MSTCADILSLLLTTLSNLLSETGISARQQQLPSLSISVVPGYQIQSRHSHSPNAGHDRGGGYKRRREEDDGGQAPVRGPDAVLGALIKLCKKQTVRTA